jgi:phosphatidylglycerol:prolipoprotein diacylglycerol transferase
VKPILFSLALGGRQLPVRAYGLAVALGFTAGVVVAAREARRQGKERDVGDLLDLAFWILVAGVLGSRVAYVLLNVGLYARVCGAGDCLAALRLWDGGLVFFGGVIAATAATALFVRRRGWGLGATADLLAPGVALGHAFGRLGCFLAGCCYGRPWAAGVTFPPGSVAFADGARGPVHPTQLYESAAELAIFATLVVLRRRPRAPGTIALVYALLYGAVRAIIEIWRGDAGRRFLFQIGTPPVALSTSQAIGIVAAAAAAALLLRRRARDSA